MKTTKLFCKTLVIVLATITPVCCATAQTTFEKEKYSKAQVYFKEARIIADREFNFREDSIYYFIAHDAVFWHAISFAIEGDGDT